MAHLEGVGPPMGDGGGENEQGDQHVPADDLCSRAPREHRPQEREGHVEPRRPKDRQSEHPETERSGRSEEHTSELQSLAYLVCRLLLEKKKKNNQKYQVY